MFELSRELITLLLLAAFVAGFIDSIAGGGGLITLPALLLAGIPPVTALATNKVQGMFGAGMAAWTYGRIGHVDLRAQWKPAIISVVAALFGALLASSLPTDVIRFGLPALLIAIAFFLALKPGLSDVDKTQRISPFIFSATIVPAIAFYDGLLGPGTGAFFMVAFVGLAGYGILRATAHTKLLNFASNVGALVAFVIAAPPLWGLGIAMGLTQMAGAYLGAGLASKIGAKLIKPVLVIASTAMALKLITDLF